MTESREEPPATRSHSQLSKYTDCARAYQLEKVRRLRRRPGAWFPGGTAVHSCIERYLRWTLQEGK
jgi:hypothetical protein